jgi:hypothetical protein
VLTTILATCCLVLMILGIEAGVQQHLVWLKPTGLNPLYITLGPRAVEGHCIWCCLNTRLVYLVLCKTYNWRCEVSHPKHAFTLWMLYFASATLGFAQHQRHQSCWEVMTSFVGCLLTGYHCSPDVGIDLSTACNSCKCCYRLITHALTAAASVLQEPAAA